MGKGFIGTLMEMPMKAGGKKIQEVEMELIHINLESLFREIGK
jgi:hypothetical protein